MKGHCTKIRLFHGANTTIETHRTEERIINTLIKLKNRGLSENTLKLVDRRLRILQKHCDLNNPEEVKKFHC